MTMQYLPPPSSLHHCPTPGSTDCRAGQLPKQTNFAFISWLNITRYEAQINGLGRR